LCSQASSVVSVTRDGSESAESSGSFSAVTTARTLEQACAAAGLDGGGAELLRLGENAIYRLASVPVVVRIARGYLPDVRAEVAVARWLESAGFPAVRLAGPADQPLVVEGRPVTFWGLIAEREEFGTVAELGTLLRWLHELEPPSSLVLPVLAPFGRAVIRIERADLADDDRAFLLSRMAELSERYAGLEFVLPAGPVHGDASVGNILRRDDGVAVLTDLDGFAVGPREWDLVQTALYFERQGWHTAAEYESFVSAYGFDVMSWPGYPVLRDMRELAMVSWLMQNAGERPEIAAEVRKRIADLRSGGGRPGWAPF
jgi:aminoglycoside phosphotransferase